MRRVVAILLCLFSIPCATTFADDFKDFLNAELFEDARGFVKEATDSFLRSRGKEVEEPTAFSRLWQEIKKSVKTVATEVLPDYRQAGSCCRQYAHQNPEIAGFVGLTSFYIGFCLADLWEWSRIAFCGVVGVTGVVIASLMRNNPAQMKAFGQEYYALICIASGSAVGGLCVKNAWNSLKRFI